MNPQTPRTLADYLAQVRAALKGADPALVQDALYDAEEHIRAELAEHRNLDEATLIERVYNTYGSPEEVAEIYRDTEIKVTRALRPPVTKPRTSALGRFFGVAADPRTYASLFYMLLSLATGIFYFTWTVTGISLSAGLMILIIGIPFAALFLGSTRLLSLVEGRLVETMLGERMPRRPAYPPKGMTWLQRIGALFSDPRTWSTLLYFVLMLPLGIVYFTLAVTGLAVGLGCTLAPIAVFFVPGHVRAEIDFGFLPPIVGVPLTFLVGILVLFGTLHLARGIGKLHGGIAKNLLVPATD